MACVRFVVSPTTSAKEREVDREVGSKRLVVTLISPFQYRAEDDSLDGPAVEDDEGDAAGPDEDDEEESSPNDMKRGVVVVVRMRAAGAPVARDEVEVELAAFCWCRANRSASMTCLEGIIESTFVRFSCTCTSTDELERALALLVDAITLLAVMTSAALAPPRSSPSSSPSESERIKMSICFCFPLPALSMTGSTEPSLTPVDCRWMRSR